MKTKNVVLALAVGIMVCLLAVAPFIEATTPVVVTSDNLVIKDSLGNVIGIVGLNTTILYCTAIDQLTAGQGVKLYRLVVENGTSFPVSPVDKQVFYRTDTDLLYIYDTGTWVPVGAAPATYPYANVTGVPDLSSVLVQNGSRPLLNNWNTGSYGIYGLTYVSTVGTVYCSGLSNVTLAGYVNTTRLLVETAATAPATPASGYVYFDTAQNNLFIYNGTGWMALGNASSPAAPDLTVYLFDNGTRPLTANWNVGSYGVYGVTWVNTTSLSVASQLWWNGYNRTDIIAHPQDSFNFLVYSEGGVSYARTGNTWQVTPSTIQACVDAVTSSGGSVIVKNGTYSEAVSLKNATRLVLDRGCVGVTVTIASGATAILEDYNSAITWVWSGGVLVIQYNNINGLITGIYANFNQYWSGAYNRTDAVVNPFGPYSYIIDLSGTTYRMRNGTTGQIDFQSTNLTLTEQFANGNLTSGLIYLKEVLWNTSLGMPGDNVMVIQSCLGELKYISATAKFILPQLVSDPNTTGWTNTERGRVWYNTGSDTMKYWNGSAIVVFPSIGGGSSLSYTLPYSYTIYVSGSTYYAEKSDGTLFSGTNASQIINWAVGNLSSVYRGVVLVKGGTYPLTATVLVNGSGTYAGTRAQFSIIGEGRNNTVFVPAANVNAFTIQNFASVVMKDFSIILPTSSSGQGIYAYDTDYGGEGGPSTDFSNFENLYITGGSSGKWGMYLENIDFCTFKNLFIIGAGSGCVWINQTSAGVYNYADSLFTGANLFRVDASNGIGLYVTIQSGAAKTNNLLESTGILGIIKGGSATNTTGIWAGNMINSRMSGLAFEALSCGIYADACQFCIFEGTQSYTYTDDNTALVEATSNCYGCTFRGFYLNPADDAIAFVDARDDPRNPNIYEEWMLRPSNGVNINNTVAAGTIVRNMVKATAWGGTFTGFNGGPVGYITNPIKDAANMLDYGGNGAIANDTLYTVYGQPKTVYVSGGTVGNVTVNGQQIFAATGCTVRLVSGDTFIIVWSAPPTIKVFGE